VDRLRAQDDGRHRDEDMHHLVERLKRKQYRATRVRRPYSPKGEGQRRPLGLPAVEDQRRQLAVRRRLPAIAEPDFLRWSYGYRPRVGAVAAVDRLTLKLPFGRYHVVVAAAIEGFVDNSEHGWWVRLLNERSADGAFLRRIKTWRKAGVLGTDGQGLQPATGTPQGGSHSPILAGVYVHDALDLWFHKVVKRRCRGEACLLR
jgi:RNA-directed DNA polymerase